MLLRRMVPGRGGYRETGGMGIFFRIRRYRKLGHSQENPDLFVKIWFDVGGAVFVDFFHVSVPDIEVYSELPNDGYYDNRGTTILSDRFIEHRYYR